MLNKYVYFLQLIFNQDKMKKLRNVSIYLLLLLALPLHSQVTIQMEKQGNVFYIPGKINGLKL